MNGRAYSRGQYKRWIREREPSLHTEYRLFFSKYPENKIPFWDWAADLCEKELNDAALEKETK